jgi:hypothetical protein
MSGAPKPNDLRKVHTVQHANNHFDLTRINTTACRPAAMTIPMCAVLVTAAFLLAGGGCASKKPAALRTDCPSLDADDYYFPKGALDPSRSKIDGMLRDWYSKYLRAMMEPSVSCGARSAGYAYRFLWLRCSHHPIAVRVESDGSSVTLNAVEVLGDGEHEPGKIVKRIQRALTAAEEREFLAKLQRVDFWEMPKKQDRFGAEGAEWIVEGAENGHYQVVERWSPKAGPYHDFGKFLLDLAGFTILPLELY